MGKVFSWSGVVTGQVPRVESFQLVADVIKKKLQEMPKVIGAAICGSVLNGGMTVRSDIDVVIVYSAAEQLEVIRQLQKITAFAEKLHVPIEPILVGDRLAKTPGHGICRSFWEHLSHSKKFGGIIKADPQELLYAHDDGIKGETLQYISHKRSSLEKRWTRVQIEGIERYRFFEKALSAPIYVARKALRCYDQSLLEKGDSKTEVLATYCDYFKGYMGCSVLKTLTSLDVAYTRMLSEQLQVRNQLRYLQMLADIEVCIPMILSFLEMNYNLVEKTK